MRFEKYRKLAEGVVKEVHPEFDGSKVEIIDYENVEKLVTYLIHNYILSAKPFGLEQEVERYFKPIKKSLENFLEKSIPKLAEIGKKKSEAYLLPLQKCKKELYEADKLFNELGNSVRKFANGEKLLLNFLYGIMDMLGSGIIELKPNPVIVMNKRLNNIIKVGSSSHEMEHAWQDYNNEVGDDVKATIVEGLGILKFEKSHQISRKIFSNKLYDSMRRLNIILSIKIPYYYQVFEVLRLLPYLLGDTVLVEFSKKSNPERRLKEVYYAFDDYREILYFPVFLPWDSPDLVPVPIYELSGGSGEIRRIKKSRGYRLYSKLLKFLPSSTEFYHL